MPRKSGSKQRPSDGIERNVPARIREINARLCELEKGICKNVEDVAADAVPDLVRAEIRGMFKRWADDLEPK